jgi:CRISPR-associated protein Cas4
LLGSQKSGASLRDARLANGELVTIDSEREDLGALRQENIRSARYAISGRPDRIMKTASGMVPVELKSGMAPRNSPHDAQLAQLFVYCLLVEEQYQTTVREGVIQYTDQPVTVPFDEARSRWVLGLIAEVHEAKRANARPGRSHNHAGKCRGCGFREACPDTIGFREGV